MSTSLQLDLTDRTDEESGSLACQRLRDVGQTPGVLYGNQGDTVSVKVDTGQLKALVDRGIRVLDFAMNGSTEKAMFRELQWDTFGITVTHFDLLRIDAKQRIEIEIPVELRGTAPGTNSGGALEQPLRINHLEIGDSVTAGEIELDSDVNLLVEPDAIVVRVVEIREEEDAAVLEDGEFESGPIEPEVIGRSADEDESDEDE